MRFQMHIWAFVLVLAVVGAGLFLFSSQDAFGTFKSDISLIFNSDLDSSANGLVAHWTFDTSTLASGGGPVTFDASSSASTTNQKDVPFTFTHTVTSSGSNRLLVVGVHSVVSSTQASSSVSYNGTPMTLAYNYETSQGATDLWYMVNPPTGSHTVSVTLHAINLSGEIDGEAVASSWLNVSQTNPLNATSTTEAGNTNAATVVDNTLTPTAAGLLIDTVGDTGAAYDTGGGPGTGQTLIAMPRSNSNQVTLNGIGASYVVQTAPNAFTFQWTDDNTVFGSSVEDDNAAAFSGLPNTYTDIVGGHTATISGGVVSTTGRISQGISFDGSSASLSVGSVSSNIKSISFWMRAATSTASSTPIDLNGTAGVKIINGTIQTPGWTSPTVYVDDVAGATTVNDTKWHHVVITSSTAINASAVVLGKFQGTFYSGSLDDVRMYSKALTAKEVDRLYHLGGTDKIGVTLNNNPKLDTSGGGEVAHWTFDGKDTSMALATSTITVDATSSTFAATPITENHTVGSGSNQALVALISLTNGSTVSSVKLDNTSNFTRAANITNGATGDAEIWYLTNPGTGAHTVNVVLGSGSARVSILGLDGVSQSVPVNATSTKLVGSNAPNPFLDIAPTVDGTAVADAVFDAVTSPVIAVGSGETLLNAAEETLQKNTGSSYNIQTTATTETMDWTESTNGQYVIADIAMTPATSLSPYYNDVSGHNLNITATGGAPKPVIGKIGQALSFNGSTDYISAGSVSSTVNSISFWMRAATSTASSTPVDLNGTAGVKIINGTIQTPGWTSPTIYVDGVAGYATVNDTRWHHVVITSATSINASAVVLGKFQGTFYSGSLDDVRMYSKALTQADVTRLYQLGGTINYVGVGSGNLAVDSQESGGTAHTNGNSATSPMTWSFTNTAGNLLVCELTISGSGGSSGESAGTVSYNGVAMTQVSGTPQTMNNASEESQVYLFYLLNPATGSHTVSMAFSGTNVFNALGGCISFSGANTSSPVGTAAGVNETNGTSPITANVTGTTNGDIVVSALCTGTGIGGANSPTTLSSSAGDGSTTCNDSGIGYQSTSGGTATASYSVNGGDDGSVIAVEVFAGTGGAVTSLSPVSANHAINATPARAATASGLNKGLVLHWTFDGKDMINGVIDSSGSGNNGYINKCGSCSIVSLPATTSMVVLGAIGQGLLFSSTSADVSTASFTDPGGGKITATGWLNKLGNDAGSGALNVVDTFLSAANGRWILGTDGSTKGTEFCIWGGAAATCAASAACFVPLTGWHFVAGTYDGATERVYLDGTLCASQATTSPAFNTPTISIDPDNDGTLNPRAYDDIRVYSRALSATEIKRLYQLGHN